MRKIFKVEGSDIRVISHAPSPGFDPLTAGRAELEENGFPPVPEDPRLREKFAREWDKLKNKIHYIEPQLRVVKREVTSPSRRRPRPEGVTNPSENWCGAVVLPGSGEIFQSVIGSWIVPAVTAPAQGGLFGCSIWVGIDGALTSSTDLFQAGVQLEVGTTYWQAFWEWVPGAPMQITNFPVSAGDNMLLMICTTGAGSKTGGLFWVNATTGGMVNVAYSRIGGLDAPGGTELVGNCAEWIVEAPQFAGEILPLANFGSVTFLDCQAVTTNKVVVNGGTGEAITMNNPNGAGAVATILGPETIQCLQV